jgi:hypothetical protein
MVGQSKGEGNLLVVGEFVERQPLQNGKPKAMFQLVVDLVDQFRRLIDGEMVLVNVPRRWPLRRGAARGFG